jgi:hypothetical protein
MLSSLASAVALPARSIACCLSMPYFSTLNMIDASTLNNLDDLIEGMPLNARILEIIKAGYTRAEIARAAGKTNSAVTQWISGEVKEIKASSAAGIQARTGYNSVWIATGKGPKLIASAQEQAQYTDFYGGGDNVPTTITRLKRVWVVGRASGGVILVVIVL